MGINISKCHYEPYEHTNEEALRVKMKIQIDIVSESCLKQVLGKSCVKRMLRSGLKLTFSNVYGARKQRPSDLFSGRLRDSVLLSTYARTSTKM